MRNNIEYIPTYGSIQGSQLTLANQKGNAFDTASLLIALYRAAGIPARYVYGTVQIPIDKVMNWVGGVTEPMAALQLLGQGGIPNTGMAQGGVIKFVKMEHVWVEAWIDFIPSRGAKHKTGDTWVALDASFKQYDYLPAPKMAALPAENASLRNWMQAINVNAVEGWSDGYDLTAFQSLLNEGQNIIEDYFQQIDYQISRQKQTIVFEPPVLAAGLPYKLIARGSVMSDLPSSMRHYFKYALYASDTDRTLENAVYTYQASLPFLAGKRISIGFAPASDADRALIESYLPDLPPGEVIALEQLPASLPGYLVHMTAELKADGQRVAGGGSFVLGSDLSSTIGITKVTGGWHQAVNRVTAGDYFALGLDLQGYSDKQLIKQLETSLDSLLQQTAVAYFANVDNTLEQLNASGLTVGYRVPSFGLFGSRLESVYSFGVPKQVLLRGTQVDVDAVVTTLVTPNNDSVQRKRLTDYLGMNVSALEYQIPQVYLANQDYPAQGLSTVSVIARSLAAGQRLYKITAANVATAPNALNQSEDVKTDIRNAVNAGMEALIPQSEIQVDAWWGTGYILSDPRTGSGYYRISGGANGEHQDNEIGKAVSAAGIFGGANVAIKWPKVSADEGVCGEDKRIQLKWTEVLLYSWLTMWFLKMMTDLDSDGDCGCGGVPAESMLSLNLWYRDVNAGFNQPTTGCPVFVSGWFSQRNSEMWATTEHIQEAQGRGSAKRLTWLGREEREPRGDLRLKPECSLRGDYHNEYENKFGTEPSQCDEYPFNSTLEGQPIFYKHPQQPWSLKLVPARHNSSQGGTINAFYRNCNISKNQIFEVRPDMSFGTKSHGVNAQGEQCYPSSSMP